MVGIETIRGNYAQQSDEWLQHLAVNEGETLTEEALCALFDEFRKRDLNSNLFFNIMNNRIAIRNHVMQELVDIHCNAVMANIWMFAIGQKMKGLLI